MVHYSVLLPQRDAGEALGCLLPPLNQTLERLVLPYELICIDDGSAPATVARLAALQREFSCLRVLRFAEPRGTSAALTAGMQAARGRIVLALGAATRDLVRYVPELIGRLSRCDLFVARAERPLAGEFVQRLLRVPRGLLGIDPGDADRLCWIASRDALQGLTLPRGAWPLIDTLVVRRGYRAGHLLLAAGLPPQGSAYRPNWFARWSASWLDRKFEPHLAREHARTGPPAAPLGNPSLAEPTLPRHESPATRTIPEPSFLPADKKPHEAP